MKAILSQAPGGPETLVFEDAPAPEAKRGEVVIAVRACGVNFPDTLIIQDVYQFKPERPFSPGGEVAGVVASVGEGVDALKAGDRVAASMIWGGYSQQVAVSADAVFKIPDEISFETASCFPLAHGTSLHALKDRANLQAGETLLVLGAAGGVGIAAVQIGKLMGARVIAAASSEEKVEACRAAGADAGLVYPRAPFDKATAKSISSQIKEIAADHPVDVVYDAIGGPYAEPALRAVNWNGRYLVVGFAAGAIPKIPLNLLLLKGCSAVGVFWGEFAKREPLAFRANFDLLCDWISAGELTPLIDRVYDLENAADALKALSERRVIGKLVLRT
ncbi:MAG: NADPH:quinone oxidoreductase family protein [Pseudomonadota bacterium]